MKKIAIPKFKVKINTGVNKMVLKTKKYSPEILAVTGVVTGVMALVSACKSTTKAKDILAEKEKDIDDIRYCQENMPETYSEEDRKKDVTMTYCKTMVKLAKCYLPTAILFTLSVTAFLSSNDILKKRNAALAAAYTSLDEAFHKYRKNTIDKFGEDVDKELRGIKAKVLTTSEAKEDEKDTKIAEMTEETPGGYAFLFDEVSSEWHRDTHLTAPFLKATQNLLNTRLQAEGYMFLNTVLKELDLPLTEAGQIIGWVWNKDDPSHCDTISFGVDFDEYEISGDPSIWLDFNCRRLVVEMFERFDTDRMYKNEKRKWIKR